MLKLVQINLHHCRAASYALSANMVKENLDIALIQEPWTYQGRVRGLGRSGSIVIRPPNCDAPRACVLVGNNINMIPLWEHCCRDLVAVKLEGTTEGELRDIVVASVYLPFDQPGEPPTEEMDRLVKYCREQKLQLILGCDANAHHIIWGSSDTNKRGEYLAQYIITNKLEVLNRNNEPTFVNINRREVIDITVSTIKISKTVSNWHVSDEPSLSDHRYIRFDINREKTLTGMKRNPKNADWVTYRENLEAELEKCLRRARTPAEIELMEEGMRSAIHIAFERSCPLRERRVTNVVPWWTRELSDLRKKTRKLFNKAKSTGAWDEYKTSLTEYNKALRRAKREAWRRNCEHIESVPECARLQKALIRDDSNRLGSLKKTDGCFTETGKESLELLLNTHFPGCQLVTQKEEENIWSDPEPLRRASREDWKIASSVVNQTKLKWAIGKFKPFKSPGLDGIHPVMLQQGLDLLSPRLCEIFRASLALGYIPRSWRSVKVVFIPKPGRASYYEAKSFRPINLTSFLLKTLERLTERHIRDVYVKKNPLHKHQYAYQPGMSCEKAIHEVVGKVEKALSCGEIALAAFLDIEGAFDNTSFTSIRRAVEERGTNTTICRWIDNMLRNRKVQTQMGEVLVEGRVAGGCPQGGVFSPLLWALTVDSLLTELSQIGVYVQAYADDIVIIVIGKFGSTVSELMQKALKTVERWCNLGRLRVNPEKTKIVPFTRKRNMAGLKNLAMYNIEIPMAKEVKYLGVTLDTRLTFRSHLEKTTNKAIRAFWACRRTFGKTWGLKPEMVHWLYTAVVRPIITYASLAWWQKTKNKDCRTKLSKVQRMACLGATGAMRTTPTASMEVLLELPPLHLVVKSEALRGAYRLKISGVNVLPVKGDHTEIFKNLNDKLPLRIMSDRITKNYSLEKPFQINIPERDQWEQGDYHLQLKGELWFTDGSKTAVGTGAGIYRHKPKTETSLSLGQYATVFQAEIIAILVCVQEMIHENYQGRSVNILTDSQAALKALDSYEIHSRLVLECVQNLTELGKRNKVRLVWVPGHQNIPGNCKADHLARTGAESALVGPEPTCGIAYSVSKKIFGDMLIQAHREHWRDVIGVTHSKAFLTSVSHQGCESILSFSRRQIRLLTGIITGHCTLNKHLHTIGLSDTYLCRGCNEEEETPLHILTQCEGYITQRVLIFGREKITTKVITEIPRRQLLDFFEVLELF